MSKKKKSLNELLEEAFLLEEESPYEIPKSWFWTKLEFLVNKVQYGFTEKASFEKVGPHFLRITDLEDKINWETVPYCAISDNDYNKYKLNHDDIVVARMGSVGKSTILKNPQSSVFASYLIRLVPNHAVLADYLSLFMQSNLYWKQIEDNSKGTTRSNINSEGLKNLKLPIAPLNEQKRIVNKIGVLFAKIDEVKQLLEEAKETFELRHASILYKAFNGELTESEENEKWNTRKLGDLIIEGPQNGLYKPQTAYGEGNLIVRIDNFYDGYINSWDSLKRLNLNLAELETYGLEDGDLLINRVNSIQYLGKSSLVRNLKEPCVFESNVMRLKTNKELIDNEYLILYLNSNSGLQELRKNAKHAVNQASINQTDVKNVLIPLPSLEEQKKIVTCVGNLLEKESTVLKVINEEYLRLNSLKQTILSKAFKGELGTNDPVDEPAIELLESILHEML